MQTIKRFEAVKFSLRLNKEKIKVRFEPSEMRRRKTPDKL